MTIREELDYQDGQRAAFSYLKHGFSARELRHLSFNRSDAYCNGFHDEVHKQYRVDTLPISHLRLTIT